MNGPTAFFQKTYDETFAMLVETRNYIAFADLVEQRTLPLETRLEASYQSMRVTSRLIQVMAWLLAWKAVHAGELSEDQALSDAYALSGGTICSDPSGTDDEALPSGLRSLLDRSQRLYVRVMRLDDMLRREAEEETRTIQ